MSQNLNPKGRLEHLDAPYEINQVWNEMHEDFHHEVLADFQHKMIANFQSDLGCHFTNGMRKALATTNRD